LPDWRLVTIVGLLLANVVAVIAVGARLDSTVTSSRLAGSSTSVVETVPTDVCRLLGAVAAKQGMVVADLLPDPTMTECATAAAEGARVARGG
jgi:hypothetical protein